MAKDIKPLDMSPLFPPELLGRPCRERVKFFREKIIKHPEIERVCEEILCAVEDVTPGSLVICCGPPGVGKSTVSKKVEEVLTERRRGELENDPGALAVASMRLKSPQNGNFDWKKHYFKPLLVATEEPLVDKKIDMSPWAPHHASSMRILASPRADCDALRDACDVMLEHRKPTAVLIDDAQHAGVISSGRRQVDQTNTFKSMAEITKVTHVLFATYEFVSFRNLNGQVSRRSTDIHFLRYRAHYRQERDALINVIYTFQRWLALEHMPVFVKPDSTCPDWDYFYEHSLGCVGVLKDWLTRAYSLALREGAKTLTFDHLDRRALSVSARTQLLAEITGGEDELEDSVEKRRLLRVNLKLEEPSGKGSSPGPAQTSGHGEKSAQDASKRSGKGRRPGKRNAVRDEIGERAA
jgi:energy-coupling factor transporter ATP-binding protein EcfA2